jgi:hypothetical protein
VLARVFGPRFSRLGTRAYDIGPLLDTVMICAVGTILIIRTDLWLTHYPQLGGHGLHIAHMLWGGLTMLIALILLLSFLSPIVRRVSAILGGIGLGFFIDELGKFLTADNNYFFKPTAAIIYIFFIAFYLVSRALQARHVPTSQEYLTNSIELAKDAAIGGLDEDERRRALRFLDRADQADPAVAPLRTLFQNARVQPEAKAPLAQRLLDGARERYRRLANRRGFIWTITIIFVLWGLVAMIEILSLIFTLEPHLHRQKTIRIVTAITSRGGNYGFVEWANIVSSIVADVFILWGLVRLRKSRLAAYAMWDHALMVEIFFVQVFVFIQTQFAACFGFLIDLLLLISIRFMAARERELVQDEDAPESEPALARAVPA